VRLYSIDEKTADIKIAECRRFLYGLLFVLHLGQRISALNDANQKHDDRSKKEQVDELAERKYANKTKKPQYDEYYCNCV